MTARPPNRPSEQPRSEPEIIPPRRGARRDTTDWTSFDERGVHRVYVARLGPFSIVLLLLAIALVAALFALLLIGAFLIWIPVAAILVAIAIVSAWWRGFFRR